MAASMRIYLVEGIIITITVSSLQMWVYRIVRWRCYQEVERRDIYQVIEGGS
jgi:hypothetical protein